MPQINMYGEREITILTVQFLDECILLLFILEHPIRQFINYK